MFKGFTDEGAGLEFHADILMNYKDEFQDSPMHGQFILVQLASSQEAVVGRITALRPEGRLSRAEGEEYALRAAQGRRQVPDDLRKSYLRYRVNLRVLGVIRIDKGQLRYAPSHRRLPHVGSHVAFPTPEVLRYLGKHTSGGEPIGYLSFGEYIFGRGEKHLRTEPWMQIKEPAVLPRFDIKNLVSRRTFIFARAGFGKSNLNKLLFKQLYEKQPTIRIGKDREVKVGTVIFDPDGEYFWPDANGNRALCDAPELEDKIVLFTDKDHESAYYKSFKADNIRLDIRRLKPKDVIDIALSSTQQSQQNVKKLRGLPQAKWIELVNLIDDAENSAPISEVAQILGISDQSSDAEAVAARSNMTHIVRMLHSRQSRLLDKLMLSLKEGKLCIIDISNLRGKAGLTLAGIIMQRIFEHNQSEFTKPRSEMIPVIAVIEEAQSVLGSASSSEEGPFVSWVKEGRKYNLGAVLVTQQPGSITEEILSQGDNWFIFHLLSAGDLESVRRANAHFSKDLLSSLLNEPIPGNGVFWSSSRASSDEDVRPYPIPIRVLDFGSMVPTLADPTSSREPGNTYAKTLNPIFEKELEELTRPTAGKKSPSTQRSTTAVDREEIEEEEGTPGSPEKEEDVLELMATRAIEKVKADPELQNWFDNVDSVPWYWVMKKLEEYLPNTIDDVGGFTRQLVPRVMNEFLGERKWDTEFRDKKKGPGKTMWIIRKD